MKGQNIGAGLSLIHRWVQACFEDDEYGSEMGAPMDELGPLITRGRSKELRRLRRRIKALTGLRWRAFTKEVERRTSARWVHFGSMLAYAEQYYGYRQFRG